jgi:hypothetical protein
VPGTSLSSPPPLHLVIPMFFFLAVFYPAPQSPAWGTKYVSPTTALSVFTRLTLDRLLIPLGDEAVHAMGRPQPSVAVDLIEKLDRGCLRLVSHDVQVVLQIGQQIVQLVLNHSLIALELEARGMLTTGSMCRQGRLDLSRFNAAFAFRLA